MVVNPAWSGVRGSRLIIPTGLGYDSDSEPVATRSHWHARLSVTRSPYRPGRHNRDSDRDPGRARDGGADSESMTIISHCRGDRDGRRRPGWSAGVRGRQGHWHGRGSRPRRRRADATVTVTSGGGPWPSPVDTGLPPGPAAAARVQFPMWILGPGGGGPAARAAAAAAAARGPLPRRLLKRRWSLDLTDL
jgi:hypothetical protein